MSRPTYTLQIEGEMDDVKKFQDFLGGKDKVLTVDGYISEPKAGTENDYDPNGWRRDDWGAEWGICDAYMEYFCECEEMFIIIYSFMTTTSASVIPVIKALGERFPAIEFELRMSTSGMRCDGIFVMTDGKVSWEKIGKDFDSLPVAETGKES